MCGFRGLTIIRMFTEQNRSGGLRVVKRTLWVHDLQSKLFGFDICFIRYPWTVDTGAAGTWMVPLFEHSSPFILKICQDLKEWDCSLWSLTTLTLGSHYCSSFLLMMAVSFLFFEGMPPYTTIRECLLLIAFSFYHIRVKLSICVIELWSFLCWWTLISCSGHLELYWLQKVINCRQNVL